MLIECKKKTKYAIESTRILKKKQVKQTSAIIL